MLCPLRLDVDPLDTSSPPPISLELIRAHCGADEDALDDLLELYLFAAITWAENATHRTIVSRGHRWVLADFPQDADQIIALPRGRTVSVDGIQYATASGTVSLSGPSDSPVGTDFEEDLSGDDGGVLRPANGGSWPSAETTKPAPVVITFTAGWEPEDIPKDIIHAILFAVSDMLELRGSADLATAGRTFDTRETLISSYRLSRWY